MLADLERRLQNSLYMPKLPWKKGEIDAFKTAGRQVNAITTPIFVMPPAGAFDHDTQRILSPAEHIRTFGPRLREARGNHPVFVDAIHLDDQRHRGAFNIHPLTALLERARLAQAQAWPVTSYGRSEAYQEAVAKARLLHGSPVAFQIRLADLGSASLGMRLKSICNQVSCDPSDGLLVIDCGPIHLTDEGVEYEFVNLLIDALNQIPSLYEWAQIALVATSLGDLQKVKPQQDKLIRRSEWSVFKRLMEEKGKLFRLPAFADYGVEYRENLSPIKASPSAKLNYTTDDSHFFVKGLNVKRGGYEAVYAVAKKLVDSGHFMGPTYSQGDDRIQMLANKLCGTGNAPTWRWSCADHHLAVMGRALMGLFGVPGGEPTKVIESKQVDLFSIVPAK
jgi:hypothetical protein